MGGPRRRCELPDCLAREGAEKRVAELMVELVALRHLVHSMNGKAKKDGIKWSDALDTRIQQEYERLLAPLREKRDETIRGLRARLSYNETEVKRVENEANEAKSSQEAFRAQIVRSQRTLEKWKSLGDDDLLKMRETQFALP